MPTSLSAPRTRQQWWVQTALGSAVVLAGLAVLWTHTPGESRWLPPCLFHQLTGLFCPGCGLTRALHALAHGNLVRAWSMNPLTVLGLFAFLVEWADRGLGQPAAWRRGRAVLHDARVWAVVVLVFMVGRNLPWMPFAAWAPG